MSQPPEKPSELVGGDALPEDLPQSPMPMFRAWFDEAIGAGQTRNPDAIALATSDASGNPSVRMVLCKHLDDRGYLVFYTNRHSRKGGELAIRPRASAVFHLDASERQIRVEGAALESPEDESDAYFASRSAISRIGAWASDQSKPIESREAMLEKVAQTMGQLGLGLGDVLDTHNPAIARPPHWGGYRLWFDVVELWTGGTGRIHDRARWSRELQLSEYEAQAGPWTATRLQP